METNNMLHILQLKKYHLHSEVQPMQFLKLSRFL